MVLWLLPSLILTLNRDVGLWQPRSYLIKLPKAARELPHRVTAIG
jgi:hypothetical protein